MDLAYDHIQEEALQPDHAQNKQQKQPETTLNADFQEAYKAISSSPWGAKLGGFFGSVVKQVCTGRNFDLISYANYYPGRVSLQRSIPGTLRRRGRSIQRPWGSQINLHQPYTRPFPSPDRRTSYNRQRWKERGVNR